MAISQALVQMPIMHLPFTHEEIEILRGRFRRSRDLKLAFPVERHFWDWDTFISCHLVAVSQSESSGKKKQHRHQAFHNCSLNTAPGRCRRVFRLVPSADYWNREIMGVAGQGLPLPSVRASLTCDRRWQAKRPPYNKKATPESVSSLLVSWLPSSFPSDQVKEGLKFGTQEARKESRNKESRKRITQPGRKGFPAFLLS
jgi:hypothetical protein